MIIEFLSFCMRLRYPLRVNPLRVREEFSRSARNHDGMLSSMGSSLSAKQRSIRFQFHSQKSYSIIDIYTSLTLKEHFDHACMVMCACNEEWCLAKL